MLTLTSIGKRFGTLTALDDVSLIVRRGTVHALLGENGAGKTTLMRIAFGMLPPDAGSIRIDEHVQQFHSPADAIAAGIGMVHQHFTLVPAMTVAENIALGGHGRYQRASIATRVLDVSRQHSLAVDPNAIVADLPIGAQQRVEILKALVRDAKVLILDEPTAVLTPAEARALLGTVRDFVRRGGSVVLITHKLRDALEFADDVTVLRRGKVVYHATAADSNERILAKAMIGDGTIEAEAATGAHAWTNEPESSAPAVLTLKNVSAHDDRGITTLQNVTLAVRAGEILGIAAVEGNGQYELLRILAGRLQASAGDVQIPSYVGFIPEDRHRDALVLDAPLFENVTLANVGKRHGTIAWSTERETTRRVVETYDVRTVGIERAARTLSGGNQQKLVIGREIETAAVALVAENPTRGLDIQATAAVHNRLRDARIKGTAVVVYSSDLDEVLALADRVVVVVNGDVREVAGDRETIGSAMVARRA